MDSIVHPLITVSGPSGSGKTTLVRQLCKYYNFRESVSVTTREQRSNEVDGEDYWFITDEQFDKLQNSGRLIENVEFDGNRYGTDREPLQQDVEQAPTLLVVSLEGIQHILDRYTLGPIVNVLIDYSEENCASKMLLRGDKIDKVYKRILHDRGAFNANKIPKGCIIIGGDGQTIDDYVDTFFSIVPGISAPVVGTSPYLPIPHKMYASLFDQFDSPIY